MLGPLPCTAPAGNRAARAAGSPAAASAAPTATPATAPVLKLLEPAEVLVPAESGAGAGEVVGRGAGSGVPKSVVGLSAAPPEQGHGCVFVSIPPMLTLHCASENRLSLQQEWKASSSNSNHCCLPPAARLGSQYCLMRTRMRHRGQSRSRNPATWRSAVQTAQRQRQDRFCVKRVSAAAVQVEIALTAPYNQHRAALT